MIDKVILDIAHSDDYTDYLFMTAALTNSRVIPLIDPSAEELRRQSDGNAFIFKCRNSRKALESGDVTVRADQYSHTILVLSRIYLDDDGEIDAGNAEIVRSLIQKAAIDVLESAENLKEVYRLHLPTFWAERERIYGNPRFFYARTGIFNRQIYKEVPLGVIIKAIEEAPDLFRSGSIGGCHCKERPILIDYEYDYAALDECVLHTWCPTCRSRRGFKVRNFDLERACSAFIGRIHNEYDKGQGFSTLSLFDVLDALSS